MCLECLSSVKILQAIENQIKGTVKNRDMLDDVINVVKYITSWNT